MIRWVVDRKKKEDVAKDMQNSEEFIKKEDIDEMLFFRDNPEVKPFESIVKAIAKDKGIPVSEAIEDEGFKTLFEGKKEFDTISSQKTVMESNSRTVDATDNLTKARKMQDDGGNLADVERTVSNAVLEAYEIKK